FDAARALATTFTRIRAHLTDIANFEPLALLVVVAAFVRASAVRLALVVVVGQILVYVPFFVAGVDPAGGARFFADVLAIEHVLLAIAVASLLPGVAFSRRALVVLALACAGFGVHAVFGHASLAHSPSDAGRPKFEPDVLREANVT